MDFSDGTLSTLEKYVTDTACGIISNAGECPMDNKEEGASCSECMRIALDACK